MHRWWIGLVSLPLLAQSAWVLPPPPAPSRTLDLRADRVFRTPLTTEPLRSTRPADRLPTFKPAAKPCAIPLVNTLRFRQPDSPMPKFKPGPGRFPFREFPAPAPSCEDKERK